MNNLNSEKKVTITIKISDELKRKVETICYRERITTTAFFIKCVNDRKIMKKDK